VACGVRETMRRSRLGNADISGAVSTAAICAVHATLTGRRVARIVADVANRAGLGHVRPHGLRHAAGTDALDAGVDLRKVQRFSRHKDLRTLTLYDGNRSDFAGDVASVVAGLA
jgi:site-specific recombinase XerD